MRRYKVQGISRLAEDRLVSKEGLCSMALVSWLFSLILSSSDI